MGFWQVGVFILGALVIYLLVKLFLMRSSLKKITAALHEKLHTDTNTPIATASSDPAVCHLAAELNLELQVLREEQLRLKSGNHELQSAITNIAHDLRTPLTAIIGYLELLEQEKLEKKPTEYVAVIRDRADTLKELTEELFRYSIIDNTADDLRSERVSLNDALEIALAAAYQILAGSGITPEIDIPEQPVMRELDKKALQRIFSNILHNVAKYSDGDLSVSLNANGTITFSNSASSLSEIEVGKLFDRFYTVENASGSTGLGLSIAKLLTEKMGGSIEADYLDGVFSIRVHFE